MEVTKSARQFFGITFVALAAFLVVGFASASHSDFPLNRSGSMGDVTNLGGPFGSFLAWGAFLLFGRMFAWTIPFALAALAINSFRGGRTVLRRWVWKLAGVVVLLNAVFALTPPTANIASLHGAAGDVVAGGLSRVFGSIGTAIILVATVLLLALGELGMLGGALVRGGRSVFGRGAIWTPVVRMFGRARTNAREYLGALFRRERFAEDEGEVIDVNAPELEAPLSAETADEWQDPMDPDGESIDTHFLAPRERDRPAPVRRAGVRRGKVTRTRDGARLVDLSRATLPPISILAEDTGTSATFTREELKKWSLVVEEKLVDYGVQGKVAAVHHGPVVTTFEFEPAAGVRIKDIVNRADDLALAMRARSLRMIAPIPGRAAVGIEIPNHESAIVLLRTVLETIDDRQRLNGVMIAVGVDVVGKPFVMNLCSAPHMLIAGTTGSGKSVCLNTMIASILFQYRPSDVRILMVDPKIVEMNMYDGIPHLMHPVITDPKEAGKVLSYLVDEMRRRNLLFRRHGVKNIASFNAKVAMGKIESEEPAERLPYIVLIVDELGDLVLAKGVDIEGLLTRLAQMARAAGIHMVLATQRPSVDVLVGKTKANFPMRVAFRVATRVDSRTILDEIGAEKLLGKGDMLFVDSLNPLPVRLHGAWVSEDELEQLVDYWKSHQYEEASLDLNAGRGGSAELAEDLDPLFEDARGVVIQFKQGSTSLLQRKLHIGYARAARVLDQLEEQGIVGPPDGSRPREVYADGNEAMLDE